MMTVIWALAGCSDTGVPTAVVYVDGLGGTNLQHVPTGGSVAQSEKGWRVATRRDAALVWSPDALVETTVLLPVGWDPGAATFLDSDRALIALRGLGSVVVMDLSTGAPQVGEPLAVCAEPRGLAVDPRDGTAWVACRSGELVHVDPDGQLFSSFFVERDLRDVVVDEDRLWVSLFRAAEVLEVDPLTGAVLARRSPAPFAQLRAGGPTSYQPRVARRMVADPGGGVALLHQLHQNELVDFVSTPEYYGPPVADPEPGSCDGIVLGQITHFGPDGLQLSEPPMGVALPLDLAYGPDGKAYLTGSQFAGFAADVRVGRVDGPLLGCTMVTPVLRDYNTNSDEAGPGSGLALDSDGTPWVGPGAYWTGQPLYTSEVLITCASCHPDGLDDGHTWTLASEGGEPRRTPSLVGGLSYTAPFHWDGRLDDLRSLWDEVGVARMGLANSTAIDFPAVEEYIDELPEVAPVVTGDPEEVVRGDALFADPAVGCVSCHPPPRYTDNRSYEVGTGGEFQVPSLVGVAARLPVMHSGCADTLEVRFTDPSCGGGDQHGTTSHLSADEVRSLVVFLETL
jgi:hypothetical protein